ncbi:MAG: hypothetical protein Q8L05_09070 [Actinomycetota bacterium]|nr:hypothetical protein [Actinomycetota bacterium]MDP2287724.1 hypothetical protein [Actinomycetota bacterium]
MSQSKDFQLIAEAIPTEDIRALAMSPHEYTQQAIWWTRLAAALDSLAEAVIESRLRELARYFSEHVPYLSDQALALEEMESEALQAIGSARMLVTRLAGRREEARSVRETVKWVHKRIQLINYLVEDLDRIAPCAQVRREESLGLSLDHDTDVATLSPRFSI